MVYDFCMGRSVEQGEIVRAAAEADRLFTAAQINADPPVLSRLEQAGVLRRVIHGVYLGAQHPQHRLVEAAAWTLRRPSAVVGLLTAAVYFDLTDAFARGTWLLVPTGASAAGSRVDPVHFVRVEPRFVDPGDDVVNGILTTDVHDVRVRITGPDRTALDLLKFVRRVPEEYALDALRRRLRADDFEMPRFARLADRLGVWTRIEPLVQGLALR
jgi:predicted transcriptional regulator of viral defense system